MARVEASVGQEHLLDWVGPALGQSVASAGADGERLSDAVKCHVIDLLAEVASRQVATHCSLEAHDRLDVLT